MRLVMAIWLAAGWWAWAAAGICASAADLEENWQPVFAGGELRIFSMAEAPGGIAVLRADPNAVELELGTAISQGQSLTLEAWAQTRRFHAAINAGMYRMDDRVRSTALMYDTNGVVSSFIHPNYGAIFLFQPKRPYIPPVRFVDRSAEPQWNALLPDYGGAIQGILLFGPRRVPAVSSQGRRHSQAALGVDSAGRLLLIHCRPRLSLGELAQALLDLPLDLVGAMFLEGGADAGLFIATAHGPRRFVGDYASEFAPSNEHFWPVPNVLGLRPRAEETGP